jgi:hypothetical protein
MHTIRKTQGVWTVGYWRAAAGGPKWEPTEEFNNKVSAYELCNFLNGGSGVWNPDNGGAHNGSSTQD